MMNGYMGDCYRTDLTGYCKNNLSSHTYSNLCDGNRPLRFIFPTTQTKQQKKNFERAEALKY